MPDVCPSLRAQPVSRRSGWSWQIRGQVWGCSAARRSDKPLLPPPMQPGLGGPRVHGAVPLAGLAVWLGRRRGLARSVSVLGEEDVPCCAGGVADQYVPGGRVGLPSSRPGVQDQAGEHRGGYRSARLVTVRLPGTSSPVIAGMYVSGDSDLQPDPQHALTSSHHYKPRTPWTPARLWR